MTPPAGQAASTEKATEPAARDTELLGVAVAGDNGAHSEEAETEAAGKPESQITLPAGEAASVKKAAEPAIGDTELLGVAGAGDEGAHNAEAQAARKPEANMLPPEGGSVSAEQTSKLAADTLSSSEPSGSQGAAKDTSASGLAKARVVSDITQAAAETPGDAKAAEPAGGSLEFLGAAKATNAASEPANPAPHAANMHAPAAEGVCTVHRLEH